VLASTVNEAVDTGTTMRFWRIRPVLTLQQAATILAVMVIALSLYATPTTANNKKAAQTSRATIPSTARELADRLGFHARPFVGNQPEGQGRPWLVWFSLSPSGLARRPHSLLHGSALFINTRRATVEVHYFNTNSLIRNTKRTLHIRTSQPLVSNSSAIQVALQWLARVGIPIPAGSVHVDRHPQDHVNIFMCCFHVPLIHVSWTPTRAWSESVFRPEINVYINAQRVVVHADVGALLTVQQRSFSHPCASHPQRDTYGTALGRWCFDYESAAHDLLVTSGSTPHSRAEDSQQISGVFVHHGVFSHASFGQVKVLESTPTHVVYRVRRLGVSYAITFIPAFPGIAYSDWEVVLVRRT
jgi:hypothetical protein